MQVTLGLLLGLTLAQTQPTPALQPTPAGQAAPAANCQSQGYSYETQGNFTGVYPWSCPNGNDCQMTGGCPTPWCDEPLCCCRTTGDFYPHYAYPAPYFGYYYFRPYNWIHIAEHQGIVARWGLDPRIPYSHELFNRLYASLPVEPPTRFNPRKAGSLPTSRRLPNIEEILDKKLDGTYDPISIPAAPAPAPEPAAPAAPAVTN